MHFRALVYYCLHVVHTALWSRMWSKLVPQKSTSGQLKIGKHIRRAVEAARRKAEEQNTVWSARKRPTEICGQEEPKPHGQAMWSKAFESREVNAHLKGFFFFRRCRIVTLVAQIVKCKIYFVCYSSVAHDELNAIYRKRYASPQNHIFAPKIIGSNKQRKRPGENFESEYNNLLKNNWLSGIMYA